MKVKYFFPNKLGRMERLIFEHQETEMGGRIFMKRKGWNDNIVKTILIPMALTIEALTYIITAILF